MPPKVRKENGIEVIYDSIWVIVDRFSAMKKLIPVSKEVTSHELCTKFIEMVYPEWGMPDNIVSDRDTRFTTAPWTKFCKDHHIERAMSTAYHPRTDGQTEVANKAIIQLVKAKTHHGDTNWLGELPFIQATLNRTMDASRNATPFAVALGHNPRLIGDISTLVPATPEKPAARIQRLNMRQIQTRKNLVKAKMEQTENSNRRRRAAPHYQKGDKVLLSTKNLPLASAYPKTAPEFVGPFTITATYPQTDNYTLQLPAEYSRLHPTFHVESLKKYIPNDDIKFPSRKDEKPGPLPQFKDEELYEVDRILAARTKPRMGTVEYKVKWKGYNYTHNSWVTAENVSADLVDEFNQRTSSSLPSQKKYYKKKKSTTHKRKRLTVFLE